MNAILCKEYGTPDSLVWEHIDPGTPREGELLIEVKACGVNFPDTLTIQGLDQYKPSLPFSPGAEIAGLVLEVGEKVTNFNVGDRVMSGITWGGYREQVIASAHNTYVMPDEMDFETGSVFLCAYGTAYHCLVNRAQLQDGETLAVLGAAGGIGAALIQVGKLLGANVIACASTDEKLETCKNLGADELINYSKSNLKVALKSITGGHGADVVCDPVGGIYTEQALRATAWKGRLMILGFTAGDIANIPLNLPLLKGNSIVGVFWSAFAKREPEGNRANVAQLIEYFRQGKLKPHIYRKYPLRDAPLALNDLLQRRVQGKIVLIP